MRLFVWDIWKSKPASNLRLSPAFHSSSNFKCCLSIFCIQHFKSINSPILLAPHSLCKHRLICVSGTIRKIVLSVLFFLCLTSLGVWCIFHAIEACMNYFIRMHSSGLLTIVLIIDGQHAGVWTVKVSSFWPGVLFFAFMRLLSVWCILHHQHECFIKTCSLVLNMSVL